MAVFVYNTATGALVSWSPNDTDPVADAATLAANGLTAVKGLTALDATHAWDATTKTVIIVAAPVQPNFIPAWQFIMLFTPTEHAAIAASTDQKVAQFMMAVQVVQQIDLNNPIVQACVNYLVTAGLLASANAALILSGQASQ